MRKTNSPKCKIQRRWKRKKKKKRKENKEKKKEKKLREWERGGKK